MTRPTVFWRLIARVESRLPSMRVTAAAPPQRRWIGLAAFLPSMVLALFQVVLHRAPMAEAWPMWRPVLIDLALFVAGGAIVAGAAAGVHAWRRAHA